MLLLHLAKLIPLCLSFLAGTVPSTNPPHSHTTTCKNITKNINNNNNNDPPNNNNNNN